MTATVQPVRVYADTSVYGGVFDAQFADASRRFFDAVHDGRFELVLSALVRTEIEGAPQHVREFVVGLEHLVDVVEPDEAALRLRSAYLEAGIVSPNSGADALHVALATCAGCRVIVSWNFRHIVHYRKIPLYNGINQSLGYAPIAIHSPLEVTSSDD